MRKSQAPRCLQCKYFIRRPLGEMDKAMCEAKSRGIPNSTYIDGKKCNLFSPKNK